MNRLTKKDFNLRRFPNGEFALEAIKTFTGELEWKYGDTFANGEKCNSPAEEFIALMQLEKIADKFDVLTQTTYCDFLPYKRQDKDKLIGEATFNDAYSVFNKIELHDVAPHDSDIFGSYILNLYSQNIKAHSDIIVFPDCGAQKRFRNLNDSTINEVFAFDKVRNAKTGELEFGNIMMYHKSLKEFFNVEDIEDINKEIKDKNVVILDDIIAYGGTFKYVAKEMKKIGAKHVKLVVNHSDGVYNKKDLKENGIDEIVILNGGL